MIDEILEYDTPRGRVTTVTVVNASGASVQLISAGAGVRSLCVPDRNGEMADVVLGYADVADYFGDGPAAGKIPGRYANRIARGTFTLDGVEYHLPINNGPNTCHSGPEGFHNRNWTLEQTHDNTVVFAYTSADGECGFPGTLTVRATYHWSDDTVLSLRLEAVTDKATVLNLTNHAYWHLGGFDTDSVLDHLLWLPASRYLPTDPDLVPTGALDAVTDTPMDFTTAKKIGRDIKADFPALLYGKGYDNCWVIDGADDGKMHVAARLHDDISGRTLTVSTDQPAVQVYTGNWLTGCPAGKHGEVFNDYAAVAIECQNYPDAPNQPEFPSAVLRPGEKYVRNIFFALGID